jgi:DNA-binding GntR family transcriptional regulator
LTVESLSSLDRSTLRERTLKALRSAIMSGLYRPGERLKEAELAEYLGVSRGTVRQALQHLQQEGLVTVSNRSKLHVNSLSPMEVRELFRVRAALEALAVTRIMALPERREVLNPLREALSQLADADVDFAGRVEADLGFHLQLCRLSGNSMLVEAWRYLEGRIRIVIMGAGPDKAPVMMSRDRHELIIDAIESGDLSAAVTVVNQHMSAAADHFTHVPS